VIAAATAGMLAVLAALLVALAAARERTAAMLSRFELQAPPRADRARLRVDSLMVVGACAASLLGFRLAGVAGSLAAVAAAAVTPRLVRRRRARRRERQMQEHLAEAVALIATAMRSGRSLLQAIELSADELDPSLGATLRRLVDRTELGHPMDEAIDAWAAEVRSPDARLVAGVLKLHRRTGGSLSTTLEDLAGTLRSRRSAAREIESLTAQARLSATILGLLPIGFFLFLSVVARGGSRGGVRHACWCGRDRTGVRAAGGGLHLEPSPAPGRAVTDIAAGTLAAVAALAAFGSLVLWPTPDLLGPVAATLEPVRPANALERIGRWPLVRRMRVPESALVRLETAGVRLDPRAVVGAKVVAVAATLAVFGAVFGPVALPLAIVAGAFRTWCSPGSPAERQERRTARSRSCSTCWPWRPRPVSRRSSRSVAPSRARRVRSPRPYVRSSTQPISGVDGETSSGPREIAWASPTSAG
jgi:Type II secretion system (T2SS), protein F